MSPKVITAVYEKGVLRPLEKLDLPENGLFRLTFTTNFVIDETITAVLTKLGYR